MQEKICTSDNQDLIKAGLRQLSKERFSNLLDIRGTAINAIRNFAIKEGFTEVTTCSLVNIAGSCENPYASFTLSYYGREAHLSQSAQLQLEALVIRLRRSFFTVNNSYREENYDDPESAGRRLSEFTLIECEKTYKEKSPDTILNDVMDIEERLIKRAVEQVLSEHREALSFLGAKVDYLMSLSASPFNKITYDEALSLLNSIGGNYKFGDDFGIKEERKILRYFNDVPVFVTYYPAKIKFFNMARTSDNERTYSVDLLAPCLGETSGGAVRETDGHKIKEYLLGSRIAEFISDNGGDTVAQFREYLELFEQEPPVMRGGFGLGFERFIGFLLNSTDILETVGYRTMKPNTND